MLLVRVPQIKDGEGGKVAEVSQPPTTDPGKRDIAGASKDADSAPAGASRVTDLRDRESAGARKSRESAKIGPPLGACVSVCQAIGGGKVAGKPAPAASPLARGLSGSHTTGQRSAEPCADWPGARAEAGLLRALRLAGRKRQVSGLRVSSIGGRGKGAGHSDWWAGGRAWAGGERIGRKVG